MAQRKIDDIELLRGFSILLVLMSHFHGSLIFWSVPVLDHLFLYIRGASGVDLFFVISGFVIARDLYPKLTACTTPRAFMYTSLAFWIRRVWRIFPSAWLWLAVILLAAWKFNNSGSFRTFSAALKGTIAAVFQFHNYWFATCFRHFECGANFYYWTLSLEEQFYLLLPIAIFICRRWFPHVLVCLVVFQLCYPDRPAMMSTFRTDGLLLGVLIALWSKTPNYRFFEARYFSRSRWLRMMLLFGLLAALAADIRILEGKLAPIGFSVIALISAALVLIGSYDKNSLLPPGIFKQVVMWFGSRSFSLYLVHLPAFLLTREIWYRFAPQGTVYDALLVLPFGMSGALLVLLLAEANYRLVDSPTRRMGARISARFMQRHSTPSHPSQQLASTST